MLYRVHLAWEGFELTTLAAIGTDCIDNYHKITTTTGPVSDWKKDRRHQYEKKKKKTIKKKQWQMTNNQFEQTQKTKDEQLRPHKKREKDMGASEW